MRKIKIFSNNIFRVNLGFNGDAMLEVMMMAKMKKNPSRAGVSAASVKGNAGPGREASGIDKQNSQNSQYKK